MVTKRKKRWFLSGIKRDLFLESLASFPFLAVVCRMLRENVKFLKKSLNGN